LHASAAIRPRARPSRRAALLWLAGTTALATLPFPAPSQEAAPPEPAAPPAPVPFSFDLLSDDMRLLAAAPLREASLPEGFLSGLTYDDYQHIRFRRDRSVWREAEARFRLQAFYLGWLFREPVVIREVVDGTVHDMPFSTDDFEYLGGLADRVPLHEGLPGVAGFRLLTPLNRADTYDELVAFLGASYFRALGRGSAYGLSARGLAVNTGLPDGEEFPRFSSFYVERPAPGAETVTVYAGLESPSLTGAYRFVIRPGETTVMDVTARLWLRRDVAQLGIAPLTSMFLFGPNDRVGFDDYRPRVHDSEGLLLIAGDGTPHWRPLVNPPRLANSYIGQTGPRAFGLMQRSRAPEQYLDAGARYERRPSLLVEPAGDWGRGTLRLVEIPSDLEANDNIVAFWVPEAPARKGDALEFSYRLRWGDLPPEPRSDRAYVLRTLAGEGGISGVADKEDRRKFVVDYAGGLLAELPEDADVAAEVTAAKGEIAETVLSKLPGEDVWRLVMEVEAEEGAVVELKAQIRGYGQELAETWLYQWMKE